MSFRPSPGTSADNWHKQKRKTKPKYGHVGPCVYDFTHFGAGGSTKDIPANYLQQDRMKYSRSASHSQTAEAGFSFESAVGSFDPATDSIPLSKDIGGLFSTAACP